jgi:DNA primase
MDNWLDTKERVRQATDIVDLVGSYIQLRRDGSGFAGLCPWHDDSSPSLKISPQRQTFKCWVCDLGGDVFSFIMQREGVDFREALELLADRAGIPLEEQRPQEGAPQQGAGLDKRTLLRGTAWAEKVFHECLLKAPEAELARAYLQARGISEESIERFQIGFAPQSWDWLLARAERAQVPLAVLERNGLVAQRSGGSGYYDRFRGRVIFSIHDAQARPIAFGGRILPEFAEGEPAKYINSPETALFSKSKELYALDLAKATIAQNKNVIVVEGYTDVVLAHQCGVTNAVACLGTALGERHVKLLKRYADRITLVLDGDEAGQKRTNEILELFIAEQANLKILTLPNNLDPCDFLLSHGSEAFAVQLAEAIDALDHKIRVATNGLDIAADPHLANEALEDILGTLARAPRLAMGKSSEVRLREHQVLTRLARQFRVDESSLRTRLEDLRTGSQRPRFNTADEAERPAPRFTLADLNFWDRELIELILALPDACHVLFEEIDPEDLHSPAAQRLYSRARELTDEGITPSFDRLMLEAEDPNYKSLLISLDERVQEKQGDPAARMRDVLASFRRQKEDATHQKLIAELRDGNSSVSEEQAFGNLMAQLQTRHRKPDPTEG